MRVELVRTGGFANLRFAAAVDDAALPAEERDDLRALVAASGFWSLPAVVATSSPSPDRLRYELTVEDAPLRRSVVVSEPDVPAPLAPLVAWLEARAHPAPLPPRGP